MRLSQLSPSSSFISLAVIVATLQSLTGACADWPQWRGANRDDISTEKGLLQEWPEGGPQRVWLFENCGVGYSGPAVVGDRLYIMGARKGKELLLALDVKTGNELWAAEIGNLLENNWGDGPRGTPTVDGEYIYALGAQGNLICVETASGDLRWRKTMQELGGAVPTWGYTESPFIHNDLVLCTPGGEQGAIAAFDKKSGDLVWQSKDATDGAHYSSIVARPGRKIPEAVQLLPTELVGFDPTTGKIAWRSPWPGRVAVIPTPIVRDNFVYITSGYGVGCRLVEVGDDNTAKKIYDNKVMKNHHGGVILLGDHLYGHSDGVGWVCQDLKSGEQTWRERSALGKGAIAYADGRFYCLSEDEGHVVLIEASPEGWKEHGRFTLDPQTDQRKPQGKIWTHPVICDGKLYLRDQNLLFCFDISAKAGESADAAGN